MPCSSAMEATKYSKYVSLMGVKALEINLKDNENKKNGEDNCNECNCKNKNNSNHELMESLCYACRHIIQDLVRRLIFCLSVCS